MALDLALGTRTEELDLGGEQELVDLVPDGWVGLDRPRTCCNGEDVWFEYVEEGSQKLAIINIFSSTHHGSRHIALDTVELVKSLGNNQESFTNDPTA